MGLKNPYTTRQVMRYIEQTRSEQDNITMPDMAQISDERWYLAISDEIDNILESVIDKDSTQQFNRMVHAAAMLQWWIEIFLKKHGAAMDTDLPEFIQKINKKD